MKKSSLVGIEVFYEEQPVVKPPFAPPADSETPRPWGYDDDDDDDDDNDYDDEVDKDIEEIKVAFEQVYSPVAGEIYKVRGLGLCAQYVGEVYTPLSNGKIRTMSYHKAIFYVDGQNVLLASDKETQQYAKEDYDTRKAK
jgi:hypothetical protein